MVGLSLTGLLGSLRAQLFVLTHHMITSSELCGSTRSGTSSSLPYSGPRQQRGFTLVAKNRLQGGMNCKIFYTHVEVMWRNSSTFSF